MGSELLLLKRVIENLGGVIRGLYIIATKDIDSETYNKTVKNINIILQDNEDIFNNKIEM